jgi:hypothetical protein
MDGRGNLRGQNGGEASPPMVGSGEDHRTRKHLTLSKLHQDLEWLAALDDFRNWLQLGLQPAKGYENRRQVTMSSGGSGEVGISHGASEAEQLFDPERA